MRLTCPTCGAEYEPPADTIPTDGRHVQCSACHTRWFVRGVERKALSEDEIIQRLEARGARAHLRAVPPPDAGAAEEEDGDFAWEGPEATEPDPSGPPAPETATSPPVAESPGPDAAGTPSAPSDRPADSPPDPEPPDPEPPGLRPAPLRPVSWPDPPTAGLPQPQKLPQGQIEPSARAGATGSDTEEPLRPARGDSRGDPAEAPDTTGPGRTRSVRPWVLVLAVCAILGALIYLMAVPVQTG